MYLSGPHGRSLAALVARHRAHDADAERHGTAVARLALRIALELRLPRECLAAVALGALLHDVGKLTVPRATLGGHELDEDQWNVLRNHPAAGEALVAPLVARADVRAIVRWHHERADGHGYPDGLAGEAIPLAARIVAVADAYDAMTTARPYAAARTPEDALLETVACTDRQFDARCVEALAGVVGAIRIAA